MKACPFCAEQIQDEAVKCRYCGEFLESKGSQQKATYVRVDWNGKAPKLETDGEKASFMDLLATGITSAGYVLVSSDKSAGLIRFETAGLTWHSWSGEEITVSASENETGSFAIFNSKGKPSGQLRLAYATNATKYVEKILPFLNLRLA